MAKKKGDLLRLESGLSVAQENAASLLAVGNSITEVARQLDVERETIYRWLKQPAFCRYYKKQLKDVRREIRGRLSAMAEEASATLKELMTEGGEQARLKAAVYVLDRLAEDERTVKKSKQKKNEQKG